MPSLRGLIWLSICLSVAAQEKTDALESERKAYDDIYLTQRDVFSTQPNAFMVRTMTGRKPGRALDVAMGQGRNALWLAAHGWTVTGFDISPVAVDQARKEAERQGLRIEALVAPYEEFGWGKRRGI